MDAIGPWTDRPISLFERRSRMRCLVTLAVVFLGPDHPLVALLLQAETGDVAANEAAFAALMALPSRSLRRILATMGRIDAMTVFGMPCPPGY